MRQFDEMRAAHREALHGAFLAGFVVGIITGAAITLLVQLGVLA